MAVAILMAMTVGTRSFGNLAAVLLAWSVSAGLGLADDFAAGGIAPSRSSRSSSSSQVSLETLRLDDLGEWHTEHERAAMATGGDNRGSGPHGKVHSALDEISEQLKEFQGERERQIAESEQGQADSVSGHVAVAPRPSYARVNNRAPRSGHSHSHSRHASSVGFHQDHLASRAEVALESPPGSFLEEFESGNQGPKDAIGIAGAEDGPADEKPKEPTATGTSAGCLAVVLPEESDPEQKHFRIDGDIDHIVSGSDMFELYRNKDCSGRHLDVSLMVSPIVDVDDVLTKSYISIQIGKVYPGETMYVCQRRGRASVKTGPLCLAEVSWERPSIVAPSLIFSFLPDFVSLEALKDYHEKVDQLADPLMYLTEWAVICCGILLLLSMLHALHFILTTERIESPPELKGLFRPPILNKVLSYTFFMATFSIGIQSLVALSTKAIAPHIQSWVVEALLLQGLWLGILGLAWLTRISCIVQINEAAVMHGQCVVPLPTRLPVPLFDLVVMTTFVFFLGLIASSLISISNIDMADFSGCLSGLLGVIKVFNTVVEQRGHRAASHCHISLSSLRTSVESLKGGQVQGQEASSEEKDLLDQLGKHHKVDMTMDQVCAACRKREDPFQLQQQLSPGEELPGGSDFNLYDIRWHAKFVHDKTGSKASILTVPLACGLLLFMLLQFARTTYQCKTLAPHLTSLKPSTGVLVPDFSPETKEYVLLHDRSVMSFSFLTETRQEISKEKEFSWNGNFVEKASVDTPLNLVDLEGMRSAYPFTMGVRVNGGYRSGGNTWSRKENYLVVFTQVARLVVSLTLRSGNWSRCIPWGSLSDQSLGLPAFLGENNRTIDVEISTSDYVPTTPQTLENWKKRVADGYVGFGTIFEAVVDPSERDCNRRCRRVPSCMLSHLTETGCFHAVASWEAKEGAACFDMHAASAENVGGSPLKKLADQSKATGFLCPGTRKYGGVDHALCKNTSIQNSGHFRFDNISLGQVDNDFVFAISVHRAGVSHPVTIQDYVIKLRLASPFPESPFLAAQPEGVKFMKRGSGRSGQRYTLILGKMDVGSFFRGEAKLRFLATFPLHDDDFEIQFGGATQVWDGNPSGWGLGSCGSTSSPHYRLWICSNRRSDEQLLEKERISSGVLEMDLFDLPRTKMTAQVRPKAGSAQRNSTEAAEVRIQFQFYAGGSPSLWAMEDNCTLYGQGTFEQISESISDMVLLAGIRKCRTREIHLHFRRKASKKTGQTLEFTTTLSYPSFLAMAVRKAVFPMERLKFILAAVDSNATKEVQDVIEPLDLGRGFQLNNSHNADLSDLSCYLPQDTSGIRFTWDDIISGGKVAQIARIACRDKAVAMPPSVFASLINKKVNEDDLIRLLRCAKLPIGLEEEYAGFPGYPPKEQQKGSQNDGRDDWLASASSPLAIATKMHYSKFLTEILSLHPVLVVHRVLHLEESRWQSYPTWSGRVRGAKLGLVEHSILHSCPDCMEAVAWAISNITHFCQGGSPEDEGAVKKSTCDSLLEHMGTLSLGLGQNGTLHTLHATLTQLAEKGVIVKSLDLSGNFLTNNELQTLIDVLANLTTLQALDISENLLDFCTEPTKAEGLHFLSGLGKLTRLRLEGNKLCKSGHGVLLSVLPTLPNLKYLDVSRTRMDDLDHKMMGELGDKLPALLELNISSNALGSALLMQLLMKENMHSSLESLSLMDIKLRREDSKPLSELIRQFKHVRELQLGCNCLGDEGMPALGAALASLPDLKSLDLQSVCMKGSGLAKLAQGTGNLPLEALVLKDNDLGKGTVQVVAEHFSPDFELRVLDLGNTGLKEDLPDLTNAIGMDDGLLQNLTQLNLENNDGMTDEDIAPLCEAINDADKMEKLSLARRHPGPRLEGIRELKGLPSLRVLDLSGNTLSMQTLKVLGGTRAKRKKSKNPFASWGRNWIDKFGDRLDLSSLYLRDCVFTGHDELVWLRKMENLRVLDLSRSKMDHGQVQSLFNSILHSSSKVKELFLSGIPMDSVDLGLVSTEDARTRSLEYMVGDFNECHAWKLRHIVPRAAIRISGK